MTYGVRKSAAIAFLVLTALLVANAYVSYRHLQRLVANQMRLNQTTQTQLALKETLSLIKDLEVGERGYIITGNEDFLLPYHVAANQLDDQINKLAQIMAEDTRDDAIFAELRSLIQQKRNMADEAIRAHNQQGPDAAMAIVSGGEGKTPMDELRELLGRLERREQNVLESRWQQSQQSYEAAQISFALANTAALASVVLVFLLVRREVLESQRTTALLRRSESRFRRLVDANVMGVLFADLNGKVFEANDAFLEMVGYSRDDLAAGRIDWRAMTPAEFREQDDQMIEQTRVRGASPRFEKQFVRRDGTVVPVLLGSALLEDPPESCICFAIDLTDRERARSEVETLNALCLQRIQELETLLEVIPIGIALAPGPDADTITVNAALSRILGLPREAGSAARLPPEERAEITRLLERGWQSAAEGSGARLADAGQSLTGVELDLVPRQGPAVKVLQYLAPLLDALGRRRGSVGAFVDITDRKRLEEQLRQNAEDLHNQQRWLEAVLDLLPMPMLLIDPARGKPTFANKAALEMAGGKYPLESAVEELPDADYCTDLQGRRIAPEQMPGARVARGERLSGYELDWHLASGTRSLLINAGSLPGMYGHEGMTVMLFQDITELKQIEGELRRINQAKDTLLAMLGHELRNPLAAITGAVELIREADGREAEQAQEILERHLRHLARLVDEMLDLSRLASGKMVLHAEPVELSTILKQAMQTVQSFLESREHRVRLQLPREPVWVNADTPRLEQVFVNLLMNAGKYTDPGGRIALLADVHEDRVTVRVRDNGVGIAPDLLPRVFDLFAQLNPSIDRSDGGLGIGLNVVKSLIEVHGGSVMAHSEGVGQGSEFTVELPRVPAPAPARSAPPAAPHRSPDRSARVMVVDDNVDIARVMAALVKRAGHEVKVAHDGLAALDLARSFAPQVALLDIGLPGLSGLDLARRLRVEPGMENLFLVALTGYGQEEDRRRSAEAGFDQHLTKPVSFDTLTEVLRQIPQRSGGPSSVAGSEPRFSHAK